LFGFTIDKSNVVPGQGSDILISPELSSLGRIDCFHFSHKLFNLIRFREGSAVVF